MEVDFIPEQKLKRAVSLDEIKNREELSKMFLLRTLDYLYSQLKSLTRLLLSLNYEIP